jgi:hypothetical protein
VTLYKKRLAFLPVLVSMGVGWRLRMPPTNLEEYNAKVSQQLWLMWAAGASVAVAMSMVTSGQDDVDWHATNNHAAGSLAVMYDQHMLYRLGQACHAC